MAAIHTRALAGHTGGTACTKNYEYETFRGDQLGTLWLISVWAFSWAGP